MSVKTIGPCTQCGEDGAFMMKTPRIKLLRYVPAEFIKAPSGWVVVCRKCEDILGDENLRQAGYTLDTYGGERKWIAPKRTS